jgi:hypothetical protein
MELIRRIYDDNTGACIQVGPDGDALGLVQLRTPDSVSKENFGDVRLTLEPEMAVLVGNALLSAAADAKAAEKA